jgi:hypothetical protein
MLAFAIKRQPGAWKTQQGTNHMEYLDDHDIFAEDFKRAYCFLKRESNKTGVHAGGLNILIIRCKTYLCRS